MMKLNACLLLLVCIPPSAQVTSDIYRTNAGKVLFSSEARLEVINASSGRLQGALNTTRRNFAFAVPISSFEGFNVALQKEHFNENYLESDRFPVATFTGKIIEDIDFSTSGTVEVRAKGQLTIHGVEQERIIKITLTLQEGKIGVVSKFTVLLKDHDIKIPKIVHEKIAAEVMIEVHAELKNN